MRHGKKFNHLGRKVGHRRALLSNMATSLILHKRINTTVAKAKALRKYIEPLITKGKEDSTNSRRVVFSYLQNKESVTELFSEVAAKIGGRPGGYTRILKTGTRLGDNAEMCFIELVDFNETYIKDAKPKKVKSTRRSKGVSKNTTDNPEAKSEEIQAKVEAEEKENKVEKKAETTEKKKESATPKLIKKSIPEKADDSSDDGKSE